MAKKKTVKTVSEQRHGENPERYLSDVPPNKRNKVGYSNEL